MRRLSLLSLAVLAALSLSTPSWPSSRPHHGRGRCHRAPGRPGPEHRAHGGGPPRGADPRHVHARRGAARRGGEALRPGRGLPELGLLACALVLGAVYVVRRFGASRGPGCARTWPAFPLRCSTAAVLQSPPRWRPATRDALPGAGHPLHRRWGFGSLLLGHEAEGGELGGEARHPVGPSPLPERGARSPPRSRALRCLSTSDHYSSERSNIILRVLADASDPREFSMLLLPCARIEQLLAIGDHGSCHVVRPLCHLGGIRGCAPRPTRAASTCICNPVT